MSPELTQRVLSPANTHRGNQVCYWGSPKAASEQGHWCLCYLLLAAGCNAQYLPIRGSLASAKWVFCHCHWSLPTCAPPPTAGAQCREHPCLQYGTISARWWSCWCQFCWLLCFQWPRNASWYGSFTKAFSSSAMAPWSWAKGQSKRQILKSVHNHPSPLTLVYCSLNQIPMPWPPSLSRRRVSCGPGFLTEYRPMQAQSCQSSKYSRTGQLSTVLFELRSMPHSCSCQLTIPTLC